MTQKPNKNVSSASLRRCAGDLKNFMSALQALSRLLPERTTLRQASAFAGVMYHDAMGFPATLTELSYFLGDDIDGQPLLGSSFERVLDKFKEPGKRDRDLDVRQRPRGWVSAVEDEDDRRRKYLSLTPAGVEVGLQLAAVIRG